MLSIEFTIRIGREQTPAPEPPAVYDTAPAHIERDPGFGIRDHEPDDRQRIGFNAKDTP